LKRTGILISKRHRGSFIFLLCSILSHHKQTTNQPLCTGVTGQRAALPEDLAAFVDRIRANSNVPLAVGFGISTPEQVATVSAVAEGVVVGSAIINCIDKNNDKTPAERAAAMTVFVKSLSSAMVQRSAASKSTTTFTKAAPAQLDITDRNFGAYGGRYIPETLANVRFIGHWLGGVKYLVDSTTSIYFPHVCTLRCTATTTALHCTPL
jgi:hypothetical protein